MRERVNSRSATLEDWLAYLQSLQNVLDEQSCHVPAIEDRFFKLVKAGKKYKYNTDAIIETPDDIGSTVFETASICSTKICNYILSRKIRVNNILVNFVYPVFPMRVRFDENMLKKMLQRGINPKIISGRDLIFNNSSKVIKFFKSL